MSRPLFVPIIVGAAGQNHIGVKIAQCVMAKLDKRHGVEVKLLETLLPMMRKSGIMPIFWDENSARGEDIFDAAGQLKNHVQCERVDNFLQELIWMAAMLRQRREIGMPN